MAQSRRWRFGPFEADESEHRLWRDGRVVALTHKSFTLLVALLARAGQLVTKAELFDHVWAGRVVSDAALSRALHELRAALGDDAAQPTYVETAHGLGLRFIAPVESAASAAVVSTDGDSAGAATGVRLAGRIAELAALRDAIAAAAKGLRQLVFVTGPPGIGKTALIEAGFANHAHPRWLAAGRCFEQYGANEAYLPLREALESLAPQVGAAELRDHLLRVAPGWLAQLPWLAHEVRPDVMHRALGTQSPARLLREFAQALEMLAQDRTVVLWIEDLHWCDHSTIDALAFLAGRRDAARLVVVGSLRPPQVLDTGGPLSRLMHELLARNACRLITLRPLASDAVGDLVRMRLPGSRAVSAALGALVYRRSEGNPLFARAIVDDLLHGRRLVASSSGWTLASGENGVEHSVPDTLRELVEAQLGALAENDRRLVEAAAVAGPAFSAATLAAALGGNAADVEDRCERLTGAGGFFRATDRWAWPDGTVSEGLAFVHALYWEAVFERVPEGRRAAWQRRIAERLEHAYGAGRGAIATELAMRFEAARDVPRAIGYLGMAADAALARFAYREAVELLHRALDLAPQLPPLAAPRATMELLLPLGAALIATRGYAAAEVQAVYERALALGRQLETPKDLERALRGLWNVALVRADLRHAAELAEELMTRADAEPDAGPARTFDAHAKLGQTLMHVGQFAKAQEHLTAALSTPFDDAAPAREAPRVAGYLAWVLWYTGRPDQAMALATRALELAGALGNPHSSAFALGFVGFVHVFRGEWEHVGEMASAQAALAAEHGLAYWHAWSDLLRGLAAARGDHDSAGLSTMRIALDAFATSDAAVGLSHFHCEHAQACLEHGQLDAARRTLAAARELLVRNGNAYHAAETHRLQAEWLLAAGGATRVDEARRSFGQAFKVARRQGALALQLRSLAGNVRAARRFGRPVTAETAQLAQLLSTCAEGRDTADVVQVSRLLAEAGR